MTYQDLLFYVMDVIILVMIARMLKASGKVELEIRQGMRWLVPSIFMAIAVISWVRFQDTFRIVQTVMLVAMAAMYWFMKTGLAPEGIVLLGNYVSYAKAGDVWIDEADHSLHFRYRGNSLLFFPPEQEADIRKYLEKHHVRVTKKKLSSSVSGK